MISLSVNCRARCRVAAELSAQVEDEPDMKDPHLRALAKIRHEHAEQVAKETRSDVASDEFAGVHML